jgi:hypothetical protein
MRLRTAAPRQSQALPAGFEQRMERALAPLTRPSAARERESGSRWVLWSFFGSLAAATALAFVLLQPAEVVTPPERSVVINQSSDAPSLEIDPASGGALLALAQQNPLQRELDHVYADARDALRFLARNFLPASESTDAPSS